MKLQQEAQAFAAYLEAWYEGLPELSLDQLVAAGKVATVSVDLIKGFTHEGPLASERVGGLLPAVVELLTALRAKGQDHFCFMQDAHPADAPELAQWGPHCLKGTAEAETSPELTPFLGPKTAVIEKNGLSSVIPEFLAWEAERRAEGTDTFIIVGDCTDLCVYNTALPWKSMANHENRQLRLIVPANCVQTFDVPLSVAEQAGLMPHPGDLLHVLFLWHMALNGIEVVKAIA